MLNQYILCWGRETAGYTNLRIWKNIIGRALIQTIKILVIAVSLPDRWTWGRKYRKQSNRNNQTKWALRTNIVETKNWARKGHLISSIDDCLNWKETQVIRRETENTILSLLRRIPDLGRHSTRKILVEPVKIFYKTGLRGLCALGNISFESAHETSNGQGTLDRVVRASGLEWEDMWIWEKYMNGLGLNATQAMNASYNTVMWA